MHLRIRETCYNFLLSSIIFDNAENDSPNNPDSLKQVLSTYARYNFCMLYVFSFLINGFELYHSLTSPAEGLIFDQDNPVSRYVFSCTPIKTTYIHIAYNCIFFLSRKVSPFTGSSDFLNWLIYFLEIFWNLLESFGKRRVLGIFKLIGQILL